MATPSGFQKLRSLPEWRRDTSPVLPFCEMHPLPSRRRWAWSIPIRTRASTISHLRFGHRANTGHDLALGQATVTHDAVSNDNVVKLIQPGS
jgi:hypothetical protein